MLKGVLTVMSLCTFVMIASSAMRMLLYIWYYDLTFLRILVLWALALLAVLFLGVLASIYRESFPLFRYSMVVVTVLYLALSFSHPDFIIAYVNIGKAGSPEGTKVSQSEGVNAGVSQAENGYIDYWYLSGLSADAAPVLIPYMRELGYEFEAVAINDTGGLNGQTDGNSRLNERSMEQERFQEGLRANSYLKSDRDGFGYYYLLHLKQATEGFGIRTYNISRHMALLQIAEGK